MFSIKSITYLNMSNNGTRDGGETVVNLIEKGAFQNLAHLDLSGSLLRDAGLIKLGNAWKGSELRLRCLSLNNISTDVRGIKSFSQIIQQSECPQFWNLALLQMHQPLVSPNKTRLSFTKEFRKRVQLICSEAELEALNGHVGDFLG